MDDAGDQPNRSEAVCINCGAVAMGKHCSSCGAVARPARLAMGSLFATTVEHFLSLDLPLLRTFVDLARYPGRVVADYVLGKRQKYTNPLKYNLITAAIVVATIHLITASLPTTATTAPTASGQPIERIIHEAGLLAQRWQNDYVQVLYVVTLPLLAWMLRLLLGRRSQRNTMEFYVMCLYAYGQVYLYQATCAIMVLCCTGKVVPRTFSVIAAVVPWIYFPWITIGFCRAGVLKPLLFSLLAFILFTLIISVAFMAVAVAWVTHHGLA